MGQLFSSSTDNEEGPPPLLKPAIDGDLDTICKLVGTFIASYDIVEDGVEDGDENGRIKTTSPPYPPDSRLTSYASRTDQQQNSALHGAVFGGHLDVVTFLVEKCGCSLTGKNGMGCSPVWIAAGYGHAGVLNYLVQRMITMQKKHTEQEVRDEEVTKIISGANNAGDTPLIAAASKGNNECCRILLDSCPSVDVAKEMVQTMNNGGDAPLGVAVGGGHGGEMLEILLRFDRGSDGFDTLNHKNKSGLTPLLIACERNHANIVHSLINKGAEPSCDSRGRSPLAVAAFCGCMDVAETLLKLEMGKTLIDVQDEGGCTPLWLAARTGNVKMASLLLEAGADEDIVDKKDNLSPETVAKRYEKKAVVEFFEQRHQKQESSQESKQEQEKDGNSD